MTTMFDALGYPGKSPYDHDQTNLTLSQQVALHKARSLCQLVIELSNPAADAPVSFEMTFDAFEGTAWLLRDLIDEAGKPRTENFREAGELVDSALSDGRLLPSQETWARDLGKSNIDALRSFLGMAVKGRSNHV
jgi:hypothetical protein